MNSIRIVFFGSFQNYSVQVLDSLVRSFKIVGVVSTPPVRQGRHLRLTPTEVHNYALEHNLAVFPLEKLDKIPQNFPEADFFVVAGYGKLLPGSWLEYPKKMAINMHPSLLPQYRGPFPAEWAILRGEPETGATLVKMSPEFDKGEIIIQETIPILPTDTRETMYKKLYELGAKLLVQTLPDITSETVAFKPQPTGDYFYAKRLSREDGFIPWEELKKTLAADPMVLDTKVRALAGWPGVWTTVTIDKKPLRLKLLSVKPEISVQLEGKNPVPFKQFQKAYKIKLN